MALITNLVSYYNLNETIGTTAVDSLAAYDGTNYGATINKSGKIGTSYFFVASESDYININSLAVALNTTTTGTWSFWIKVANSTPAVNKQIIMFGNSDTNVQLDVAITTAGKLSVQSKNGEGNDWTMITNNKVINDDTWQHVVVKQNGTLPYIFVDGYEVAVTRAGANQTLWFHTTTFNVGSIGRFHNSAATSNYLDGNINEIGFWNRALTVAEISRLYNSGNGFTYPFGYTKENTTGRLSIGNNLFGKRRKNLFNRELTGGESKPKKLFIRETTIEGEVKVKGGEIKNINLNTSFNYSSDEKIKTTTTYTALISKNHKTKTGKVIITAIVPWTAVTINSEASFRLTENGNLIAGTENFNQWASGDGNVNFSVSGFHKCNIDETKTYAIQWKEGDAETSIVTGGTSGSYNILIQDII